jgi:beta-galactosidase
MAATVYLNGRTLAWHQGWDDPFDVNLKSAWKTGGPNVLAVLVENTVSEGRITAPVFLQERMSPRGILLYSWAEVWQNRRKRRRNRLSQLTG